MANVSVYQCLRKYDGRAVARRRAADFGVACNDLATGAEFVEFPHALLQPDPRHVQIVLVCATFLWASISWTW